ncbi:hypothetical protein JCM10213v2_006405 [Rhodosporidiobolus nylandii]
MGMKTALPKPAGPRPPLLTLQPASPSRPSPSPLPDPPQTPPSRPQSAQSAPLRIVLDYLVPVLPPSYAALAHILLTQQVAFWPAEFEALYQVYSGWEDALDALLLMLEGRVSQTTVERLDEEQAWAYLQFCAFPALRRFALDLGQYKRGNLERRFLESHCPADLPTLRAGPLFTYRSVWYTPGSFLRKLRTPTTSATSPRKYISAEAAEGN